MSHHPSILEQRIAWTRFRRQTDKDVLAAMARWYCWRADGTTRPFTVAELAQKAGVPKRSTERALERLEAAWWIEIIARRHRQPTRYRIVEHRLATVDPDGLTVTTQLADTRRASPPQWRTNERLVRQSGGQEGEWRTRNGPDFEKVADSGSEEDVRTEEEAVRTPSSDRTLVRQSGGQSGGQNRPRLEHPDVSAFLKWAIATYPQHAAGARLVLDRDRDGHLVHGLLEHYSLERLQAMTVQGWTIQADGDPMSHASWIARSDRSLRVIRHKAAFLERVVVGAQQLTLGPLMEQPLSEREIREAADVRNRMYGGCPHEPRCLKYRDCVREMALARRIS